MVLDVVWTSRASMQFRSLSPAEQANAQRIIETLRSNPDVGHYDYTRSFPNNGQQSVYAVYGLLVKLRHTYRGLWTAGETASHLPRHLSAQTGPPDRRSASNGS